MKTFGHAIAESRRAAKLTQRDLAAKISREDGSKGISFAYLNDIEHDRRIPASDHIIQEFARVLHVDANYLLLLASRQLPEYIAAKARRVDQERYGEALKVFQAALDRGS